MGKASRAKRERERARPVTTAPDRRSWGWVAAVVAVVVVGTALIVVSRGRDQASAEAPVAGRDHWHALVAANVCGTWAPPPTPFTERAGSATLHAGLHVHDTDGVVHVEPVTSAEAGSHATVGLFFEYGGWDIGADSFTLWTGETWADGDACPDGRAGQVRWSVNGEEREGNPADYALQDGDVLALAFLPADEEIGTPPNADAVDNPSDVAGHGAPTPGAPSPAPTADSGATDPGTSDPGGAQAP